MPTALPASASPSPSPHAVNITINGIPHELQVEPWVSLLDLLRDKLLLTGTKKGCDHGQCGACTVLVDGQRMLSCLTLAVMRDGAQVTTVEGLAGLAQASAEGGAAVRPARDAEALHPIQEAFIQHDAFQCGYCTPGQLCSAVGLINEGQARTLDDVRELMSGNLCRCGAYVQIAQAVAQVALGPGEHTSERARRPIVPGTVPG
jgi:xanthine dehydrogenase YagT iron-sulfur-binding subunit